MKRLIFVSALLVLISSCKKWGPGSVEGTVYDLTTKQPLPDIQVALRRNHNGNTDFTIAETTTDANGHFKIKFYHKAPFTSYAYNVVTHIGTGYGVADECRLDNRTTTGVILYKW